MIFVTVGTHEQPFNRLIESMDNWAKFNNEEVIMQIGFSTYKPKYCKWEKMFKYEDMIEKVEKARLVITHGGPSSFMLPLQIGKVPIVVPRKKEYGEHVNNHQVTFCREVAQKKGNIIEVEDIEKLHEVIRNYNKIIINISKGLESNNHFFCAELKNIINEMFKQG